VAAIIVNRPDKSESMLRTEEKEVNKVKSAWLGNDLRRYRVPGMHSISLRLAKVTDISLDLSDNKIFVKNRGSFAR